MEDVKLVAAYLQYVSSQTDENFWAWEVITDFIDSDPEHAWRLLLCAIEESPRLCEHIIGAGPLEDLLVHHPTRFAARVAEQLKGSSRFRDALAVVQLSTEYVTREDAERFTDTLRSAGVASNLIPPWRIALPE